MSGIEIRKKREEALDRVRRITEREVDLLKRELSAPSLKVDFRCTKTLNDWAVLLEKESGSDLFEIVRIVVPSVSSPSNSITPSMSESAVVDLGKIKNLGIVKCPHCGDKGWVKCGCGKLGCEGGVERRDGRKWYLCPWCKGGGFVEGTFETITGETENGKRKLSPRIKGGLSLPKQNKALPP